MLWDQLSPKILADAIVELRVEAERERIRAYEMRENFYSRKTQQYLTRHVNEGDKAWQERLHRFTDCGLYPRIANAFTAALYGKPIARKIANASAETNEEFDAIYRAARVDQKQRMWGQNQIVPGDAFVLVSWSDRMGRVNIHSVDPGNIFVQPDPDDPLTEAVVIERRQDPAKPERNVYWIWSRDRFNYIDQDGRELETLWGRGWTQNPYGRIPYAHLPGLLMSESYWGQSPLDGVLECHRRVNNLRSEEDIDLTYQVHGLLIVATNAAEKELETGPRNTLFLNPGEDAKYIASGADLASMRAAVAAAWEETFAIGGIPISIVRGGEAASGYALTVEYRTMMEIVEDLRITAQAAEEQVGELVCLIAREHNPRSPFPEDPRVKIEFDPHAIPRDAQAEREQDRADVLAGWMLIEDYLARWRPELGGPEEIASYVERLRAERMIAQMPAPAVAEESVL